MAKSAKLIAMSQFDIENKILNYFCRRFKRPSGEINRNTDLKLHFNFISDAQWASLAPALSDEDWMKALNVEIAQSEMEGNNTAKDLASVIWPKITKLVAINASPAVLSTFSLSLGKQPKATPKAKTKPKTKAKKATAKKKKVSKNK